MGFSRPHLRKIRKYVLERDGWQCQYCGVLLAEDGDRSPLAPTVDHIIPKSMGGEDESFNLIACCFRCNSMKGNTSYEEFIASNDERIVNEVRERLPKLITREILMKGIEE